MKNLFLLTILMIGTVPGAWAQASCASDGQGAPASVTERFISADCDVCWSTPPDASEIEGAVTIDWIVPSASADNAPLSAAANRDALTRLESLGLPMPSSTKATAINTAVAGNPLIKLRVAHGLALGGYIGASIELAVDAIPAGNWQPWLLLLETIPAGMEGTPVTRHLVRNVLIPAWQIGGAQSGQATREFREMRPMGIPYGTTPERLRVLGWVQNEKGRLLTAAQSVCAPASEVD